MASIGDSLPADIITHVFQRVHNRHVLSRLANERQTMFKSDSIPFFSKPFMPSLQDERREFARLRLVSQRWKAIADTFLFKDLVLPIGRFNGLFMNREHRFFVSVLRGGYAELVHNVHLELGLNDDVFTLWANNENKQYSDDDDDYSNDDDSSEHDHSSPDGNTDIEPDLDLKFNSAGLLAYTDQVCDFLVQHPCRCLRLSIDIRYSTSDKPEANSGIIVNKVLDALEKLPKKCKVECSIDSNESSVPKGFYEEWFRTGVPKPVSSNLSSLAITSFPGLPVSRKLFASLHHTKKLQLASFAELSWKETELPELEILGIDLMPTIEELSLEFVPISSFPKTLRRLSIRAGSDYFPDSDFFVNLCHLVALEDLRLSMWPVTPEAPQSRLALTNWRQSNPAPLPNLRILQIRTYKNSEFLEIFCSTILHVCSSLEEIEINGVSIGNETILSSSTRSLRRISLNTFPMYFIDPPEIETGIDQSAVELRWNTLCTLFARNPQISELHLAFNIGLPPLTYEKIDSISKICPRLEYMDLHVSLTGEDHAAVLKDGNAAWKLNWLYSGSTTEYRNTVVKDALKYVYDGKTRDQRFVVDLRKFRMMKDDDVMPAENGQRKTRRHRLARGSRSKK